ncbi:hypothetical protein BKA56DRAFT_589722 [Ilyonectria sp. MPI-CAGE-AT-0026]|nr:hypothetical protein BKA56DRAFT_589722 [Ilyonectria sp. MPI-CAGE-AT-0026]
MKHGGIRLSWAQDEAKQASHGLAHASANTGAETNKQRRKLQNRKNQRAHRLRLKDKDAETVQGSRPFEVRRWRVDEQDDCPPQDTSPKPASESAITRHISPRPPRTYTSASPSTAERAMVLRVSPTTGYVHPALVLNHQPFTFPLSSDHLLHLIQYNVFRAFVSNKRTLNTRLADPTTCPLSGPVYDDTTLYPPKLDIPPSLAPTTLQKTCYHSIWINIIPFPRVRDNLIRREGRFDQWEMMQDFVGDLMRSTPAPWQQGAPVSFTVPVPEPKHPLPLLSGSDTDEVTAGRKGLIVWGEPHDMQSWEVTPGFLKKWPWAVEGCDELVEISNRWRMKRGEEPVRISMSRNYV